MKLSFAMRSVLLAFFLLSGGISLPAADKPATAANEPRFKIPDTDEGLPGEGPIRRHDWFRKTWKDRRTKFAERAKQDQNAVVLLGDSITQGWNDDFTAWFPGMKIANRGISGDTSRGVLIRLQEDV